MTEYTSDHPTVHISPEPSTKYLTAFVTDSGDVIGVRSYSHDEVSLHYVNDPNSEPFIIDISDLDDLAQALQEIAEAFRQGGVA